MHRLLLALLASTLPLAALGQTSAVPALINYQGRVTDGSGVPLGNNAPVNRIVVFRIWDSPSATGAANRLYSEQQNVTISAGEFSVLIGAGTPVAGETGNPFATISAAVFGGATRFLGVTVDDSDGNIANDPEGSPRQQIVTSAFAFRAQVAESVAAGGIASTALANDSVGSSAIAAAAVTATKLASGAVGATQLADSGVTGAKIAAGAVGTTALADGAVTAVKVAAGALDSTKIADGAVTLAKLNTDAVNSGKIVDGSIATVDLAAGAVDSTKLADAAATTVKIADMAVTTAKLGDGAVTLAKQAANSVDSAKIVDGSIALADLSSSVQDGLPKLRHVYNQAVFDTPTSDPKGHTLIPIDVGDLGNDVDGCRVRIIAYHRTTAGSALVTEHQFFLQQAGFTKDDANFPDTYAWLVWQTATPAFGVAGGTLRLPPSSVSSGGDGFASSNSGEWVRFYNYYPGSLRSGEASPYNTNRDPDLIGPPLTLNILSVQAGTNKLTITVDNPHAIQLTTFPSGVATGTVTLTGISGGSPAVPATALNVIEVPSRTSFVVALTGASGTYTLPQAPTYAKVSYNPTANRYRLWAAVNPNVSARIIVSDR